eukprot:Em0017g822a
MTVSSVASRSYLTDTSRRYSDRGDLVVVSELVEAVQHFLFGIAIDEGFKGPQANTLAWDVLYPEGSNHTVRGRGARILSSFKVKPHITTMTEGGSDSKPITPDEMPAKLLGVSALDSLKLLDKDADGLKNWRHFGEALLGLNAMELREFEGGKPSLAIYNKWTAKNPDVCVYELVASLEEIERHEIVKGLREAILKSRAFKIYVQGISPKASNAFDRSNSCPSKQPTLDVIPMCTAMKQRSLDEGRLTSHTSGGAILATEETPNRHYGSEERVGLPSSVPFTEMSLSSGYVHAQEHGKSTDPRVHHSVGALQPVISLQGVYNAYSHLIKSSQQLQSGVRCEVYAASTGDLITTSTPPVLRDITLSANPRPAPNPRVTVDTAICLRILTKFSQPCYLYIINIGTSGKEALLLPNASMQTLRITHSYVVRNMTIGGPTGQEVIKVLATSIDLADITVMRDITMEHSTYWPSVLWDIAEVTLTVVTGF